MADEALSAGAAARRLGVAVTTLKTWHQRYGLGPSHHVPGQHRRYTSQDLDRLEVMLRLTSQGVAPAEAAAWAQRAPSVGYDPVPGHGPDGGGLAIPLGAAVPAARGLARAAMRLDAPLMREIFTAAVRDHGVITAWNDVALPVLIGIGERYEATNRFVEVEHLISRCVTEVLSAVPRPPSTATPRVLLAAADEDQHTLPLEALSAALAEQNIPSRLLGARVPPQALDDAITRTGPAAVILWSSIAQTGDPTQLSRVAANPHPPLVVAAAGPGWPADRLPAGVLHLTSLVQALELARAAA